MADKSMGYGSETVLGPDLITLVQSDLCKSCLGFVKWIADPRPSRLSKKVPSRDFMMPAEHACRFCVHFCGLGVHLHRKHRRNDEFPFLILAKRVESELKLEQGLACKIWVTDDKKTSYIDLSVWAEEGTPASESLVTVRPVLEPRLAHARARLHRWLQECSDHFQCSKEESRNLPTRVLELSGTCTSPMVHLTETNGRRDRYIALSHCWGSVERRPLRTTHSNLAVHLDNIPFEWMPKTFQDAVVLTLDLEIRYLWIDSLCIIQDDTVDCHSEAKNMANVYHNATLVVAASGAADSTEGLFVTERPHLPTWKLPYILSGVTQGTFNLALLPKRVEKVKIEGGPLEVRAWAFQERYLARKIVSFMPDTIYWKCSSIAINDWSTVVGLGSSEEVPWLCLLTKYTGMKLTYPNDRIHALRGITSDMGRRRQDRFMDKYGVWESHIHEQVLFVQREMMIDAESLGLPSWSWAATGGKKEWYHHEMSSPIHEYLPEKFEVNTSGSLSVAGHSTKVVLQPGTPYSNHNANCYHPRLNIAERFMFGCDLPEDFARPCHPILHPTCVKDVLGLVTLDQHAKTQATCLFVSIKKLDSSFHFGENCMKSRRYEEGQLKVHPAERRRYIPFLYWCLLLQSVEEGKYKRIGLAMLYPDAFVALRATFGNLEII